MSNQCELCKGDIEGYRTDTNACESCLIEMLTDAEVQTRKDWF
jgi:reverse gyrase